MTKRVLLVALVFGLLAVMHQYPLEALVQSVLTIYLIIVGFLIMVTQQRAWEFLRPLLLIIGALVIFPPLFRDLLKDLRRTLTYPVVPPPHISVGQEWLWVMGAALAAFIFFRVLIWYWRRPRHPRPRVTQARERVLPNFDHWDEPRNER